MARALTRKGATTVLTGAMMAHTSTRKGATTVMTSVKGTDLDAEGRDDGRLARTWTREGATTV